MNLRSHAAGLLGMAVLALACSAQAQSVTPTHYDMPNGYGTASGGSFNYWDGSYNGSGNPQVDYSPLSGGRGDLTDGVIATDSWFVVENLEGAGPYVGWNRSEAWTIDFHFDGPLQFDSVTLWHDDAGGFGDIAPPAAVTVTVGARSQRFEIADLPGDQPFSSTLVLGAGWEGTQVQLSLERFSNGLMLSEVGFTATPVPEPASALMLALGLAAVRLARRRPA